MRFRMLIRNLGMVAAVALGTTLSSCHHTTPPTYLPLPYQHLNTVIAPWDKTNDLLPWVHQQYVMIINSKEDIYATQTEKFIEQNKNWLNVDFGKSSIIAMRSFIVAYDYWLQTSVIGFSLYNGDYDGMMSPGDYALSVVSKYSEYDAPEFDNDKSQFRIVQTAIVTDKIPSDSRVVVIQSTE